MGLGNLLKKKADEKKEEIKVEIVERFGVPHYKFYPSGEWDGDELTIKQANRDYPKYKFIWKEV